MVVTRTQELSISRAGQNPGEGEPPVPVLTPAIQPPLPPSATEQGLLASLAQQVEALAAAVRGLQPPTPATEPQPVEPPAPVRTAREAQRSTAARRSRQQSPGSHSPISHPGSRRSPVHRRSRGRVSPPMRSSSPGPGSHRGFSERESGRGKRPRPPSESSQENSSSRSQKGSTHEANRAERRLKEHDRELRDINRKLAHLHPEDRDCSDFDSRPPLSRRIMEQPVPSRFKMPQLEAYDGTTDPLDHLESYKVLMRIQGATDALLCIAFPATLRKAARAWYSRLAPRSIHSFSHLEKRFAAHFSAFRKVPREADSLFSLRQQEKESLKDFVARFKAATLEVYQLDGQVAMLALKRGLRPSRLTYSLDKKPATSYSNMLVRVEKYVRADEGALSRREGGERPTQKKSRAQESATPTGRPVSSRLRSPRPRNSFGRRENYTPLLVPPSKVLMEIEGEQYLRRPPPLRPDAPRNKAKYCRFHRDHGHDTDQCFQLKREIEDLIRRGYLGKFVRGGAHRPDAPTSAGVDNQPTGPVVGMMTWGAPARSKRPREEEDVREGLISFSNKDCIGVHNPDNDPIVVSMTIAKHPVKRCLVDSGSSADVLSYDAFVRMGLSRNDLRPVTVPLVGFTGDAVGIEGEITLPVTAGTYPHQITILVTFAVIRIPLAYNVIVGRPALNRLGAIISTRALLVRFPTERGVGEMRGDRSLPRQCFQAMPRVFPPMDSPTIEQLDQREPEKRGEPAEPLLSFPLGDDPAKVVQVGAALPTSAREQLLDFLRRNADVFAWSASDMPGIPTEVITHRLNVDPTFKPVRQKRRSFAPERQKAIQEEVDKLLTAGFIRESHYPSWLANVVMVRKANGKWRICIDYTDLNKACPKDSFPLPKIDQLVDATAGHRLLSFMDAFSGYNQIRMAPEDEENTSFITDTGTYCYKMMPFGLKNAGATYQRLVNKVFKDQIGRNMEVYVDDMLVKSTEETDHVRDLEEAFNTLRQHRMKLNPNKCAFGVAAGKFLGFMVTQRGIEANPEKIRAILEMRHPRSKKEVQGLAGRVAALSRFISKSAERCLPFFKTLRKMHGFEWTEDCRQAFEDLKKSLSSPPLLAKPEVGEELFLYLAVSPEAVSSVLVRVDDEGTQKPVYYTSRVLHDAETRYSKPEKTIFALIVSAQRLRPYFQAHTIVVLTDQPLRAILQRPDTSGRMAKWAVKLSEFDVAYRPRSSMKAQVLADFLAETSWPADSSGEADNSPVDDSKDPPDPAAVWVLHVDGASNLQGSGAGLILTNSEGVVAETALRFSFTATNNQAEYEALLAGLKLAIKLKVGQLKVFTDSQLVTGQVTGEYQARDPTMARYLAKVQTLTPRFKHFGIFHIPRHENARADALSRLATLADGLLGRAYLEHLEAPSIECVEEEIQQIDQEPSWIDRFVKFLADGTIPEDLPEGKGRFKRKAFKFTIVDGQLYRKSFTLPLLKCLRPSEADYVLREIHEGICGNHFGARTLSYKALRQGYYWPTMQEDATHLVRKCDPCQRFASVQHRPATQISQLVSPWPFAQWGMDILGPFPPASGQRKFLIVAVDYFTKWVEAEALAQITESKAKGFFWKSVICHFGIPHTLVTDNGRQFDNRAFKDFCAELHIKHRFTSVGHPQTNGEAEVTNRNILRGLRTKLDSAKGRWADELPGVLWAYHTTPRVPTGETPFSLAFGSEAVIPVEIGLPNLRTTHFDETTNSDRLRNDLDLIDEARDRAQIRMAAYRQRVARYYNSRIRPRVFRPGDLVLRRAEISRPLEQGKLSPKWEGPYRVIETLPRGAHRLEDLNGTAIPRTWSAENLRVYYQ